MTQVEPRAARFESAPSSGREVRHFVVEILRDWRLDDLVDDAALCVAELATNAVLHTRAPFTVTVRRSGPGIRIDVLDAEPDQVPQPVPRRGSALDLSAAGTTGRGLQIVAVLASRWGFSTTPGAKTVWVELAPGGEPGNVEPVVALAAPRAPDGGPWPVLRLLGVPVRAAVASEIQVDDVVREVQLNPDLLGPDETEQFFSLLDHSSGLRLNGRHAALAAAGQGRLRVDLELPATREGVVATGAFHRFLTGLSGRPGFADVPLAPDVVALRTWLLAEATRQLDGADPLPYPPS
jgi:anti-sigma regulatory factor (Ser/Thr protein kinase)